MKKFDSIILDIDGTIWNTTAVVAKGWNRAIDKTYPQVPHVTSEILKGQFGKTMEVIANNLFSDLTNDEKHILMKQCCYEEHICINELKDDISFPNVIKTIPLLAKDYKLFIVSNCQNGYIDITMKKNGIEKYITDWECYGNTGNSKGQNIKSIIKRNNLKNPVYIGDTQSDLEACIEANIPLIWAAYGFGKPEKYFAKLNDFGDLPILLNQK